MTIKNINLDAQRAINEMKTNNENKISKTVIISLVGEEVFKEIGGKLIFESTLPLIT